MLPMDKFPVNEGHALIIPKRHCADYFRLDFKEHQLVYLCDNWKKFCFSEVHPDGFNYRNNSRKCWTNRKSRSTFIWFARYKGWLSKIRVGGWEGVIQQGRNIDHEDVFEIGSQFNIESTNVVHGRIHRWTRWCLGFRNLDFFFRSSEISNKAQFI